MSQMALVVDTEDAEGGLRLMDGAVAMVVGVLAQEVFVEEELPIPQKEVLE
jgi:hypothetical protein